MIRNMVLAAGLSLAGVPLTVGFYAKCRVLQTLLTSQTPLHVGLALFAVLMSVVGAFYYIRILKVMYFDPPAEGAPASIQADYDVRAVLSLSGVLLLVFGVLPAGLLQLCEQAVLNMLRHMSGLG